MKLIKMIGYMAAILVLLGIQTSFALNLNNPEVMLHQLYRINIQGKPSRIKFVTLIPKTIEGKQTVTEMKASRATTRIYEVGENKYAEFVIENPPTMLEINISTKLKLFQYDYKIAGNRRNTVFYNAKELREYSRHETGLEKDDPKITAIAKGFKSKDETELLSEIFEYTLKNIKLNKTTYDYVGALKTLEKSEADPTGFADLFVSLCRARGLPARVIEGYYITKTKDIRHTWAEVYLQNHGWIPFDPSMASAGEATFEMLKPFYIIMTHNRNDDVLNYGHFFTTAEWGSGFVRDVEETFYVEPK